MAVAAAAVAWASYAGAIVAITPRHRGVLTSLRALTLALLVVVSAATRPSDSAGHDSDAVVPVLVDVSRSMGLAGHGWQPRIDVAQQLVRTANSARAGAPIPSRNSGRSAIGSNRSPRVRLTANARPQRPVGRAARRARPLPRTARSPAIVVISDGGDTGAAGRRGVP